MTIRKVALAVLAVPALLLAGCDGGTPESPQTEDVANGDKSAEQAAYEDYVLSKGFAESADELPGLVDLGKSICAPTTVVSASWTW